MTEITLPSFVARFATLVLDARGVPRKISDRHLLLLSSILRLETGRSYREAELNAELQRWVLEFGGPIGLDHISLRRALVDEGFLQRDAAGSAYRVGAAGFDPALRDLDLAALVEEAREERSRRKREHAGGDPS